MSNEFAAAYLISRQEIQPKICVDILSGAFGIGDSASWVCYFRALKIGDASKVAPVDKLSLLLVAVFAFLFLNERPSVREWVGILG